MIKYYCDICGKEVNEYKRFTIPDVNHKEKEITDRQGNALFINRTYEVTSRDCDVCETCAMDIVCVVSGLKYAHENNVFLDNGQAMTVSYLDHEFVWRRRKE